MIELAKTFVDPAGQGRGLVVDKNAAVFDGRLATRVSAWKNVQRRSPLHRHIGPKMPRRNADLLRHVEHAEDRAAFVAAGDYEGPFNAGEWFFHHSNKE